jgi:tetratricopeptide (TPR) repeat protein
MMQGEIDLAVVDLDEALEREPRNLPARMTRGRLRELQGNIEGALEDVDEVLKLRPGLADAILLRAEIAAANEQYNAAIRDFKRLLAQNPENGRILFQLASTYLADQRPRRAIEVYAQIIEEDETELTWMAIRGRGDAQLGIGEHAKAVADYEKALKLEPEEDGLLNNLAWVLSTSPKDEIRDGKRALELAEKACELTEYKQAHILSTLAACYAELGDFDNAIKWSEKAIELGEGEVKSQLAEELESYQQQKPWRELQEQEENKEPEPEPGIDDDLVVDQPDKETSGNDAGAPGAEIAIPADP